VTLPTTVLGVLDTLAPPGRTTYQVEFTVGGPATEPFTCLVRIVDAGRPIGATLISDSPPAANETLMLARAFVPLTGPNVDGPVSATANCVAAQPASG